MPKKPLDTKKTKDSQILSDAEEYLDVIAAEEERKKKEEEERKRKEEENKKNAPTGNKPAWDPTPDWNYADAVKFLETHYGNQSQGGQQEQEEIYGPVQTEIEPPPGYQPLTDVPPVTDPPPEQQTSYAGQALQQGLTETEAADPTHILPPQTGGDTSKEFVPDGNGDYIMQTPKDKVTLSTGPKTPTVYSQYNAPTVKVSTGDSGKEFVPDGNGDVVMTTPKDKPTRDTGDTDTTTDTGAGAGTDTGTDTGTTAGTDTGTGTEATEGTTDSTPPVMTYEDWMADIKRQQEEYANRQYEISQNAAQEQYGLAQQAAQAQADASRQAAASEYERAVNDAQNAYALNRAGYGSRGESLGRNGLAMSGYSDYADQAAYAASRGEMYAAGANRFAAEQNADMTYRDNMLQADLQKSAANANAELAKEQGLASAGISYAQGMGAYQQAQEEAQAKYEAELEKQRLATQAANAEAIKDSLYEDMSSYTVEQIQSLIDSGQLDEGVGNYFISQMQKRSEQITQYKSTIQSTLDADMTFDQFSTTVGNLESTLEGMYNEGTISLQEYQDLMSVVAMKYASYADFDSYKDILQKLDEARSEGKISESVYLQAKKATVDAVATVYPQKAQIVQSTTENGSPLYEYFITGANGERVSLGTWRVTKGIGDTVSFGFYENRLGEKVSGSEKKQFDEFFGDVDEGTIVNVKGRYYIKARDNWLNLNDWAQSHYFK